MEYGSSKKYYSQIFLLFLPVIIDYSPKQNIKNNSMDKDLKKVVVLLAHPNMENSQANKALLDAIKDIEDVAIFNLYEMLEQDILNMDAWSRIISHANAVVYQFPFYWMSAPSLLKKWQDGIFTYLAKTPAVAGKPLLVVTTTGSEFDAYRSGGRNRFTVDELLRPYQGSAIHSGMVWQTPIVIYGMGTADAGKNIAEGANLYKQRVEMLINSSNAGNNW
mgnify:CR=1 FL=1